MKYIFIALINTLFTIQAVSQGNGFSNRPRLYYPQSFFDEKPMIDQLEKGKAKVTGQAFTIDNMDGAKHYAYKTLIFLMPYSDYLKEWQKLNHKFKNTNASVFMRPEVFAIRKETNSDEYGNFTFTDLKPGKYYLECIIDYQAKAMGSYQSGTTTISNGYGAVLSSTPTYDYYYYRYAAQKRAYKNIEIKENNYLLEVSLKPKMPVPFLDIEKLSAIGTDSPCFREENLQSGTCTNYYTNGEIKTISNWEKNLLDGQFLEYNVNKNLTAEGNYKKGQKKGEWRYYHDSNGKIKLIENYKYDKGISYLEGAATFYDPNGVILERDMYKNNKPNGESIFYYNNEKVKSVFTYKNGVLNGRATYYDINGEVVKQEFYENDKIIPK